MNSHISTPPLPQHPPPPSSPQIRHPHADRDGAVLRLNALRTAETASGAAHPPPPPPPGSARRLTRSIAAHAVIGTSISARKASPSGGRRGTGRRARPGARCLSARTRQTRLERPRRGSARGAAGRGSGVSLAAGCKSGARPRARGRGRVWPGRGGSQTEGWAGAGGAEDFCRVREGGGVGG